MSNPIKDFGWEPVPRSFETLLGSRKEVKKAEPIKVDEIELPNTKLAQEIIDYAKKELPEPTFNHSKRVFYYGIPCLVLSSSFRLFHITYYVDGRQLQ